MEFHRKQLDRAFYSWRLMDDDTKLQKLIKMKPDFVRSRLRQIRRGYSNGQIVNFDDMYSEMMNILIDVYG